MRSINYKGSIANDVKFLKNGSKKAVLTCLAGVAGFVATGFLPVSVPVYVAAAGFLGFGAIAAGAGLKVAYNEIVKKPKITKRVYKLLDLMGVDKGVNEHDITVADNIPMKVMKARKVKSTTGNYVIVKDKKQKHVIREYKSTDLKAYKQHILDLTKEQECNLAAQELNNSDNVVVLRKR